MSEINIGDRVRSMRGSEEGIVTKIISTKEIEVEIEDGFRIPFPKSDLVLVAKEEKKAFGKALDEQAAASGKETKVFAEKGIYLYFSPVNDYLLSVGIANNTDYSLLASVGEDDAGKYQCVFVGNIAPKSVQSVHEMNVTKFDRWPSLVLQGIMAKLGTGNPKPLLNKSLHFKAATFFKSKKLVPILGKEAYCFQLDEENIQVDPQKLKEVLLGDAPAALPDTKGVFVPKSDRPLTEVDLHIEKLVPDAKLVPKDKMMQIQLDAFERTLDNAIAWKMAEITFIHGVGNGVLKNEIQRKLSKHPHVAFFQDARKDKFGVGATYVKLK